MKSFKKIAELADRFEIKLNKYASEVGSTEIVTIAVRTICNPIIDANASKLLAPVLALMNKKADIAFNTKKDQNGQPKVLSGLARLGNSISISAKKINNMWALTSIIVGRSLTEDFESDTQLKILLDNQSTQLQVMLNRAVTAELNRLKSNFAPQEDSITNHSTSVNQVELGI